MRTRGGFTLIELLIVIAIISILAAILVPNLVATRLRAFDAEAQSCAKSLVTAAEIYHIDNRTYTGVDVAFLEANGANVCATPNLTVTVNTASDSAFNFTVDHGGSPTSWTVTEAGFAPL